MKWALTYSLFHTLNISHFIFQGVGQILLVTDTNIVDIFGGYTPSVSRLANEWIINGTTPLTTSACGAFGTLAGGVNKLRGGDYVQRKFESLAAHNVITYSIPILVMDQWQDGHFLEIKFDNKVALAFEPSKVIPAKSTTSSCGGPEKDAYLHVMGLVFHSSPTLIFTLSSYPQNFNAFFGLQTLRMTTRAAKPTDIEYSCISGAGSYPNACGCPEGKFYDPSGSPLCKSCDTNCVNCNGPNPNNCISCPYASAYNPISEKCEPCPPNCFLCSGNKCFICKNSYIADWKNDCITSCNPPYIKDLAVCKTPCEGNNTFMSWNNSCSDSCSFPFVQRIEGRAKFCDLPCGKSTLSFSYWNGSCLPTCPFYQRNEGGYNYCDACQSDYFMFPNTSCLSDCPKPYKESNERWSKFCNYPCSPEVKFYHLRNSKCRPTCEYPYQVKENIFCVLNIPAEEVSQVQSIAAAINLAGIITRATGSSVSLINFSNPATIFIQMFMDMFGYIKYLNVKYPPKLQYLLTAKINPPFTIIPEFPEELLPQIPRYPMQEKFEEDEELHSSFLVNFWSSLIILGLISTFIFLVWGLEKCMNKVRFLKSFINKLKLILRWNFTLTHFTSYFGKIVLFTFIELTTAKPNTSLEILSFTICFIINLLVFITYFKMINVTWIHYSFLAQAKKEKTVLEISHHMDDNMKSYEVVFQSLKENSLSQQIFTLLFVGRVYIYVVIIAYLFEYPFSQALLIVLLNATVLLYLLLTRPLKSKIDLIEYILQETIMLVANTSVFILSWFDWTDRGNFDTRDSLGEIIIYCNIGFSAVGSGYLLLQILIQLKAGIEYLIRLFRRPHRSLSKIMIPSRSLFNQNSCQSVLTQDLSNQIPNNSQPETLTIGSLLTESHTKSNSTFTHKVAQNANPSNEVKAKIKLLSKYRSGRNDIEL